MPKRHTWPQTTFHQISDNRRVRSTPAGYTGDGEPLYDIMFPGENARIAVWETDLVYDLVRAGWRGNRPN